MEKTVVDFVVEKFRMKEVQFDENPGWMYGIPTYREPEFGLYFSQFDFLDSVDLRNEEVPSMLCWYYIGSFRFANIVEMKVLQFVPTYLFFEKLFLEH